MAKPSLHLFRYGSEELPSFRITLDEEDHQHWRRMTDETRNAIMLSTSLLISDKARARCKALTFSLDAITVQVNEPCVYEIKRYFPSEGGDTDWVVADSPADALSTAETQGARHKMQAYESKVHKRRSELRWTGRAFKQVRSQ